MVVLNKLVLKYFKDEKFLKKANGLIHTLENVIEKLDKCINKKVENSLGLNLAV